MAVVVLELLLVLRPAQVVAAHLTCGRVVMPRKIESSLQAAAEAKVVVAAAMAAQGARKSGHRGNAVTLIPRHSRVDKVAEVAITITAVAAGKAHGAATTGTAPEGTAHEARPAMVDKAVLRIAARPAELAAVAIMAVVAAAAVAVIAAFQVLFGPVVAAVAEAHLTSSRLRVAQKCGEAGRTRPAMGSSFSVGRRGGTSHVRQ
jgi:hypothetical protein